MTEIMAVNSKTIAINFNSNSVTYGIHWGMGSKKCVNSLHLPWEDHTWATKCHCLTLISSVSIFVDWWGRDEKPNSGRKAFGRLMLDYLMLLMLDFENLFPPPSQSFNTLTSHL